MRANQKSRRWVFVAVLLVMCITAAPAHAWVTLAITAATVVGNIVAAGTSGKASRATAAARANEFSALWSMLNALSIDTEVLQEKMDQVQLTVDALPMKIVVTDRMERAVNNATAVVNEATSILDLELFDDLNVPDLTIHRINMALVEIQQDILFFQRRVAEGDLAAAAHLAALQETASVAYYSIALWSLEKSKPRARAEAAAAYRTGLDEECAEKIRQIAERSPELAEAFTCDSPPDEPKSPSSVLAFSQLIALLENLNATWTDLLMSIEPELLDYPVTPADYASTVVDLMGLLEIHGSIGWSPMPQRDWPGTCFLWIPYFSTLRDWHHDPLTGVVIEYFAYRTPGALLSLSPATVHRFAENSRATSSVAVHEIVESKNLIDNDWISLPLNEWQTYYDDETDWKTIVYNEHNTQIDALCNGNPIMVEITALYDDAVLNKKNLSDLFYHLASGHLADTPYSPIRFRRMWAAEIKIDIHNLFSSHDDEEQLERALDDVRKLMRANAYHISRIARMNSLQQIALLREISQNAAQSEERPGR